LAQVAPSSGLGRDGHAFVERMRDEAGILAMEGEGHCGFLHLSFQDKLAGRNIAQLIENQQIKFGELALQTHQLTFLTSFHQLSNQFGHAMESDFLSLPAGGDTQGCGDINKSSQSLAACWFGFSGIRRR
jgi:hypothetical protein